MTVKNNAQVDASKKVTFVRSRYSSTNLDYYFFFLENNRKKNKHCIQNLQFLILSHKQYLLILLLLKNYIFTFFCL